ncbi:hypothetical protein EJV47_05990 [Hymenobacter gummosus]|uniref:DUF3887 domain-containing protein n=1 Tax=Hymenobacter gummosus TaxID=1776032 RepID=A0A431U827_9BACT|nr:hypothetical protein [Hymenobacter gummosus]RTQ52560.1 hypothetical protein EJV47_05990 [Hymenobacter gummosus]
MKLLFTFLFLLFSTTLAQAQDTPDSLIDKFFKEYSKSPVQAVENLYSTNPWVSRKKDAVENLKGEIGKLTPDYVGKFYGYEPIVTRKIANSFVLRSYLIKYDRQPLRFTFEFYKANDKWFLFSFKFDTKIDDEIEEAAKLNYQTYPN